MNPVILLSGGTTPGDNYVMAVEGSGGIADYRYCSEVSTDYDGLILCGGSDIHPKHYGEEIKESRDIDEARDACEFALIEAFVKAKKPILGICRGMQILNVAFGGSLHQEIPNFDEHNGSCDMVHSIDSLKDSFLEKLYCTHFDVNSRHHQAVKEVGKGLLICAESDGVAEAFCHEELPIYAVQFHPERMCFSNKRDDTVDGAEIFRFFIEKCKNNKGKG